MRDLITMGDIIFITTSTGTTAKKANHSLNVKRSIKPIGVQ